MNMRPIERERQAFLDAFKLGSEARRQGKSDDDNPYPESGHERDTTFMDELHFKWYCGFHQSGGDDENTKRGTG